MVIYHDPHYTSWRAALNIAQGLVGVYLVVFVGHGFYFASFLCLSCSQRTHLGLKVLHDDESPVSSVECSSR